MVWRVERVEDLLDPVDVLAGADCFVLVDLRLPACAVDLRHRVRAEEDDAAVVDLEVVAVEGAYGRACGAVALRVVLAAVARAAEACRDDRQERDLPVRAGLRLRLQADERASGAVRLHRAAEMGAAVRDDREARHLLPLDGDRAVAANEGGAP